jgi:hypothetical protein
MIEGNHGYKENLNKINKRKKNPIILPQPTMFPKKIHIGVILVNNLMVKEVSHCHNKENLFLKMKSITLMTSMRNIMMMINTKMSMIKYT